MDEESTRTSKRYYWLKLKITYFNQLSQKKMRKQPNGALIQIIYLKMMLASLENNGYIFYEGIYKTICEEIAENLNEDLEMVEQALNYFIENNLVELHNNEHCLIPEVLECVGSECNSAGRVRKSRAKKKMLQCNTDVTECNTEKRDKREEIDKREKRENIGSSTESPPHKTKRFIKPTLEEVKAYCQERGNNIDPERFIDYYESNGWMVGKNKMKDWKAAVRTWERNDNRYNAADNHSHTYNNVVAPDDPDVLAMKALEYQYDEYTYENDPDAPFK